MTKRLKFDDKAFCIAIRKCLDASPRGKRSALTKDMELSVTTMHRILTDYRIKDFETIINIAEYLDLKIDQYIIRQ